MTAKNILVVAAHPDDEVLGCGGTIAGHADAGDVVRVLFLADGVGARGEAGEAQAGREKAAHSAAAVLGVKRVDFLGLPDNRLDRLDLLDIVQPVERVVREFRPSVVYTHHGGDLNVDHRIAHQAVLTACRPLPGGPVLCILCFETVSSTEWGGATIGLPFHPNWFVNIEGQLARKMAALREYGEEMRPFPHARSIEAVEALALLRGCSCGLPAAESFILHREIKP
jgi:LmbE family N-acetylglucosaminyl deacetylase